MKWSVVLLCACGAADAGVDAHVVMDLAVVRDQAEAADAGPSPSPEADAGDDLSAAPVSDLAELRDLRPTPDQAPSCGSVGQPCCDDGCGLGVCPHGTLTCWNAVCLACGNESQPCCAAGMDLGPNPTSYCAGSSSLCTPKGPVLSCYIGTCEQCGRTGQPCCGGSTATGTGAHMGGECSIGACISSGAFPTWVCE